MGPAERTTLEYPVLSGPLRPGFSICETGDVSGRPRTLYLVHAVRNFVCAFHNIARVDRDFVCVLLNYVCGLRNVAYLIRNGHIGFRRIWLDNDSAQSGKLDGWFAYLLCSP